VDLEDKLLIKLCEELESKRKIPKGITVRQILSNIKDIGIIIEEDNEIFFWHRIFLNYYASIALLKRLNENIDFINIVKKERKWIQIIIEAITNSNNASKFIKKLSEFVWLSSNCLTESNSNDEDLIIRVILKLLEKLESPIYSVRETSLYHLRKIDISKTYQYFLKLLNESKFVDVKMVALEEISKQ
jgi:capsular polysaccharide biosynthesis protein